MPNEPRFGCVVFFIRNLCSIAGIFLTMQKFVPQPSAATSQQSPFVPGLFSPLRHGSRNASAPSLRSPARCNHHQPTSTAKMVAAAVAVAVAVAKAFWLRHALECWPDEPAPAPASPSYPPICDACDRLHFWLCRNRAAPFFRRLNTLAVQNYSRGISPSPILQTHLLMQRIVQLFLSAALLLTSKTRIDCAPSRKLARQITPLTARSQHIQNRVHHCPPWHTRRTTKTLLHKRLHSFPRLRRQIAVA